MRDEIVFTTSVWILMLALFIAPGAKEAPVPPVAPEPEVETLFYTQSGYNMVHFVAYGPYSLIPSIAEAQP